jgi:phosphatidylcholine synthase
VIATFSIHIFTACGAACALLAILAAARADWVTMFLWLAVALFIDGIDGTLARHLRVAEALPRWSGDALDLVVDFTTYVFVPTFALATSGLLPASVAIPLCVAIVVTSAIYFADRRMKTKENYFRGFPALWNAVAFHLFVLKLLPWIAAASVAVLIVLTFIPMRVLHPFRVSRLRKINLAVLTDLDPGAIVAWLLAALGGYFLLIGLGTADN